MGKLASRIKDWAAEIFIRAEQRGAFRKLAAFERDLREYPELSILAENHTAIRAECERLLQMRLQIPGMEELTSYTASGIHQISWQIDKTRTQIHVWRRYADRSRQAKGSGCINPTG